MSAAKRLGEYLQSVKPFDWETGNCFQFASKWVETCEGFDPMQGVPPTRSQREAYRLILAFGDVERTISERMGRGTTPVKLLQTGDVVLTKLDDRNIAVGIVAGLRSAFKTKGSELAYVRTLSCSVGWRVNT